MDRSLPLCFDFFAGLMGWGEAFAESGWRVVGFDIEDQFANFGKKIPKNCELVLRDIRSITGAELVQTYGVPAVIVGSPPCQEFSYMAMPWSKAKEKQRKIEADPSEQKRLTDLFNQCFRIQREVSAAAGHYVPMIVENVRGAQKWVGRSQANYGSFHFWGDVPALMPIPAKVKLENVSKGEGNKTAGMNWSNQSIRGQDFTRIAGQQASLKLPGNNSASRWEDREVQRLCDAGVKVASEQGRRTDKGNGARFTTQDCGVEGSKGFKDFHDSPIAALGSKSSARKKASAEIAKIPRPLALWIARTFKPK
jgi:site-specific DNA-cytosine methylase